eukprot:m.40412 g.40412  ORF g.40412 m.40412 type:complete len:540 (-) comp11363_c0_seq1:65-1684(-)
MIPAAVRCVQPCWVRTPKSLAAASWSVAATTSHRRRQGLYCSGTIVAPRALSTVSTAVDLNTPNLLLGQQPLAYDRRWLRPSLVHIGVGNFFRSHQAWYTEQLLTAGGDLEWGYHGISTRSADRGLRDALARQDGLYTLVSKSEDCHRADVVGCLTGVTLATSHPAEAVERLAHARVVTMTVTEASYSPRLDTTQPDDPLPVFHEPWFEGSSAFLLLVAGLARRRSLGLGGSSVLSCDNVIGNGTRTKAIVASIAERQDAGLAQWISEECTFPCSMVDRITPATTDADRLSVAESTGFVDQCPVPAEDFCQWVIEDTFAAGRPAWETAGAIFTDNVEPYEHMKLRLLNAGHSCLAYVSLLDGRSLVDEAMSVGYIRSFVEGYLQVASATVPSLPGIDVQEYNTELVRRFQNPAVSDQLSRLASHGVHKLKTFLVPVVLDLLDSQGAAPVPAVAIAAWIRYLAQSLVVDDPGLSEQQHAMAREIVSTGSAGQLQQFLGAVLDAKLAGHAGFVADVGRAIDDLANGSVEQTLNRVSAVLSC